MNAGIHRVWAGAILAVVVVSKVATAQVPQLINYQGRLLSGTNLVSGNVGLSLRLYDAATIGNQLYEDSNTVAVVDGLYSTFIGDDTVAGSLTNALAASNVWIEVAVDGAALAPRERIVAVAYALISGGFAGYGGTAADLNALTDGSNADVLHVHDHGGLSGLGDDDHPLYFLQDGSESFGGNLLMSGHDVAGVGSLAGNTNQELSIRSDTGVSLWLDEDNNGVGSTFSVQANGDSSDLFTVSETGFAEIQANSNSGGLRVNNGGGTTNTPILELTDGTDAMMTLDRSGNLSVEGDVQLAASVGTGRTLTFGYSSTDFSLFKSPVEFRRDVDAVWNTSTSGMTLENYSFTGAYYFLGIDSAGDGSVAGDGVRVRVTGAGASMIDGIDVSDSAISNAVNVGANTILGTAASVQFTDFQVSGSGDLTANGQVVLGDSAADTLTVNGTIQGGSPLLFEGATIDGNETALTFVDPSADRTITFPDASGEVSLLGQSIGSSAIVDGTITLSDLNLTNVDARYVNRSGDTMLGHLLPDVNNAYNLGSSAGRWAHLYLNGSSSLHIGDFADEATLGYNTATDTLNIDRDTTVAGTISASVFSGDGSMVTNVSGASITDGTISNADVAANTFWSTTGNSGTTAGTHYLGTSDNQPFELKVAGQRALRIEPNLVGGLPPNLIGGAAANNVASGNVGNVIAGGTLNYIDVQNYYAAISGGDQNSIGTNSDRSVIGGGLGNGMLNDSIGSVMGGGLYNWIGHHSTEAVIAGGRTNRIGNQSSYATVGGGYNNSIGDSASYSVIGGGLQNSVTGPYGTVPGGDQNSAGTGSLAAGHRAKAIHDGSFVWADSQDANFGTTSGNQFLIRASGGVGIGTTYPEDLLHVSGTGGVQVRAQSTDAGAAGVLAKNSQGEWFAGMNPATGSGAYDISSGGTGGTSRVSISSAGVVQIPGTMQVGAGDGSGTGTKPIITRRIESIQKTNEAVVARTADVLLLRDGSNAGFVVVNQATSPRSLHAYGVDNSGTPVGVSLSLLAHSTNVVFSNAQNVNSYHASFGYYYGNATVTEISISRRPGDYWWIGTLTSSYNQ